MTKINVHATGNKEKLINLQSRQRNLLVKLLLIIVSYFFDLCAFQILL